MVLATLKPCLADGSLQLAGGPGSNTVAMTELAVCMLLMYTCRGLQCYKGRYVYLSNMSCTLKHLEAFQALAIYDFACSPKRLACFVSCMTCMQIANCNSGDADKLHTHSG